MWCIRANIGGSSSGKTADEQALICFEKHNISGIHDNRGPVDETIRLDAAHQANELPDVRKPEQIPGKRLRELPDPGGIPVEIPYRKTADVPDWSMFKGW